MRFAEEYNMMILLYAVHAHTGIPFDMDAGEFEPIPPEHWKIFYDRFQRLTREYESKLHWCTASGFHGKLIDVDEEKLGMTLPSIQ